ncbi:MAG: hypothetical protein NXI04_18285, partial [Planctomycetaceae bacterium]|nr:hypothetical protein [Planctomycetaceae bacterium]
MTSFLDRLKKRIQQRAALLARPRGRLRVTPLEDRRLLDASFGIEAGGILSLSQFDAGDDLLISGDAATGQASFTLKSGLWDAAAPGLAGPFELSADGRTLSLNAAVDTIRIAGTPGGELQSVASENSVQVSHLDISGVERVTLTSANNDFDTLQVDATAVSVVDVDDLTLSSVTADSLTIDAAGALTDASDARVNLTGAAQLSADSIVLGDTAVDHWQSGSLAFASSGDVSISADGDLQLGIGSTGDHVQLSAAEQILGGNGLELTATEVRLEAGTEGGANDAIGTVDALVSVDADVLHTSGGDQYLESERVTLGTLHSDGTLHLDAGTFVTDADTDLSGTLSLGDDAILKGDGDVAEVSLTSGSLQPGNSPGIINTGDFDLGSGSTLLIEVQGTTPGTEHDQVNVTGTVTLSGGSLSVDVLPPYNPAVGDSYVIINNDGVDAVTGTFAGLAEGAVFSSDGELFTVSYVGGDGNDVVLSSARHEFDFSATNFSASESAGTISGTVNRSGFVGVSTSVDVVVAVASGGTAAEASDFTQETITLNFAAGETLQNFAVTIAGDAIVEDDEIVALSLSGAGAGGAVGSTIASATATINNDDTATLSISNITVTESDANQSVNAVVTLDAEVEGGITLAYASALGTAEAGDVTVSGTSLSFAGTAGETENIAVTIIGDDIVEDGETFSITLGDVTGTSAVQDAAITTGAVSSGTINNDDTATLSISNITVTESDANQNVNAVVTLDAEVEGGITLAYASALGTAEAGDVTVSGTSLSFAGTAGETENIAVTIIGDDIVEDG